MTFVTYTHLLSGVFDFDGLMLDSIRFNFIVQLVIVIAHEPEMYRQCLNNYGTVYT